MPVGWLSFGHIVSDGAALPPRLYEIINCGIATTAFLALVICLRYLSTEYCRSRKSWRLSRMDAVRHLMGFRLAIGFTIFLCGEFPRMSWVWLARYLQNTGLHEPMWMGHVPWIFIPVISSVLSMVGMACIVRALVPSVWGRYGYWITLGISAVAMAASQVFRG